MESSGISSSNGPIAAQVAVQKKQGDQAQKVSAIILEGVEETAKRVEQSQGRLSVYA